MAFSDGGAGGGVAVAWAWACFPWLSLPGQTSPCCPEHSILLGHCCVCSQTWAAFLPIPKQWEWRACGDSVVLPKHAVGLDRLVDFWTLFSPKQHSPFSLTGVPQFMCAVEQFPDSVCQHVCGWLVFPSPCAQTSPIMPLPRTPACKLPVPT